MMTTWNKGVDFWGQQFRGLEGRHPSQWPFIPRFLTGVAVFFLVLMLGWYFYWSDQIEEHDSKVKQQQQLQDAYQAKILQAINLTALKKQKQQVENYVSTLEKQLPSKAEMDALLSDINQAGLGRGLQFELFKPGQVIVNDYYAELPINIKVIGSYHDIGAFASDIANLSRIVTLNNMSLVSTKEGSLSLDAIAKTFRYLDKDEVIAQRKLALKLKDKK